MPLEDHYVCGNAILDALVPDVREQVVPHLTVFEPDLPECLVRRESRIESVFFPIDGLLSLVVELEDSDTFEVAAIGRYGIANAEVAFGLTRARRSILTQVDGKSARMDARVFLSCFERLPEFSAAVRGHLMYRAFLAEQLVACSFAHDVTPRVAFWALLVADQLGRESFQLREAFFHMMLGVAERRTFEASQILSSLGALSYEHGSMNIVDRAVLESVTCVCYRAQKEYLALTLG